MVNSITWGVEYWGPELVKTWGAILDKNKRTIKAYGFNEIPEALSVFPCAVSFISDAVDVDYSEGGLNLVLWKGKTEFHITNDVKKNGLNDVYPYIRKVIETAAKSLTLNGKVDSFLLKQSPTITPAVLTWGDEIDHYGLVVPWEIRENVTGKFTVSA